MTKGNSISSSSGISPLAVISPEARIGERVSIGDFTRVLGRTVIADDSFIDSHCILGQYPFEPDDTAPLEIGRGSFIRSHSVFYSGSCFGEELITGHRVVVRGGIRAGCNFQIGSDTHLEGDSQFGDCVRTNTRVLLGRLSHVGSFVHIAPNVSTYNDPFPPSQIHLGVSIADLAVIAGGATLYPGVKIGFGAFVSANAVVRDDVLDAVCVKGDPAKPFCTLRSFLSMQHGLRAPWTGHFRRGYPDHMLADLEVLHRRLLRFMHDGAG